MKRYLSKNEPMILDALEQARKLGASAASIAYSHSQSSDISFEANRLKEGAASESQYFNVSVVVNHRGGNASGNNPDKLPEIVKSACELATFGAVAHFDEYPPPAKAFANPKTYSPDVKEYTTDRQVADCQELVDRMLAEDDSLVCGAGADTSECELMMAHTGGFKSAVNVSRWQLYGGCQKTTGTDMLFSGYARSWGEMNPLFYNKDEILKEIFFDLRHASRIVKTESGTLPLIIPPFAISRFLGPIAGAINGLNVAKGTSPLRDKLHTQCFATNLSILDNPHIDFSGTAVAYDGSGIPTQKRMLVENGVPNLFLYDYDTACMTGNAPTGNAGSAPYSMLVSPGTESHDSLIKSIKRGIYVRRLLGFGQTNMANGDFSANLSLGFLVEDGEIVGRVKDAMISGNIFELLKGEIQFSSDIDPYVMQPYMIMPGVNLKV